MTHDCPYCRLERIYEKVCNRLPKHYPHPELRLYRSVYTLMRGLATLYQEEYKKTKKYYLKEFKKNARNYIKTKTAGRSQAVLKEYSPFDIFMVTGGKEIFLAVSCADNMTEKEVAFNLCHELGHAYHMMYGRKPTERKADLFAIRWIKKLIKEGIIKDR